MIFKSEPNLYVKVNNKYIQRLTGLKGFYFDKDGLFETEKEILIKALEGKFEEVKPKIGEVIEEPKEETIEIIEKPIEKPIEKAQKKPAPKKKVSRK